jgi:hypothetical protein
MYTDLRRVVALSELEKRKGVRDKWAPGAWQAAALYNSTPKPEKRFPVIIGSDSFVKTADDLRELCRLPSSPPVLQTTETDLLPLKNEKQQEQAAQTFHIADVNRSQLAELKRRTEGNTVCVWFRGERRLAWFARCAKVED